MVGGVPYSRSAPASENGQRRDGTWRSRSGRRGGAVESRGRTPAAAWGPVGAARRPGESTVCARAGGRTREGAGGIAGVLLAGSCGQAHRRAQRGRTRLHAVAYGCTRATWGRSHSCSEQFLQTHAPQLRQWCLQRCGAGAVRHSGAGWGRAGAQGENGLGGRRTTPEPALHSPAQLDEAEAVAAVDAVRRVRHHGWLGWHRPFLPAPSSCLAGLAIVCRQSFGGSCAPRPSRVAVQVVCRQVCAALPAELSLCAQLLRAALRGGLSTTSPRWGMQTREE